MDAHELLAPCALTTLLAACRPTTIVAQADGSVLFGAEFTVETSGKVLNLCHPHGAGLNVCAAGARQELRSVHLHGQLVRLHADLERDGPPQVLHGPFRAYEHEKRFIFHVEDWKGVPGVLPQPWVHLGGRTVRCQAPFRCTCWALGPSMMLLESSYTKPYTQTHLDIHVKPIPKRSTYLKGMQDMHNICLQEPILAKTHPT